MTLWRISRYLDLSGTGGLRAPGRWHHSGHSIVYLASNPAAALLEVCVHTSSDDIPPRYTLLKVSVPDGAPITRIEAASLSKGWQNRQDLTRAIGTEWLRSNVFAFLEVPSAIVPETLNMLLNPLHPLATQCSIMSSQSYPFDPRLKA